MDYQLLYRYYLQTYLSYVETETSRTQGKNGAQTKNDQQYCGQVHRQNYPQYQRIAQLKTNQRNYSTTKYQCGNTTNSARWRISHPHQPHNESNDLHHPIQYGVGGTFRPRGVSHVPINQYRGSLQTVKTTEQ